MAFTKYFFLLFLELPTLFSVGQARVLKDDNTMMNSIDSCWRYETNWASNRLSLANCAKGFGTEALGGQNGALYVVTDPSDDPANPKPGTLCYGVVQNRPVSIMFERDMVIKLNHNLMMTNYKTIDGRGVNVEISHGPCIRVVDVNHVIIHGISLNDCVPSKRGLVRRQWSHPPVEEEGQDGDAVALHHWNHVWIDHCNLASATDGLVDITHESTDITVSNNYLAHITS